MVKSLRHRRLLARATGLGLGALAATASAQSVAPLPPPAAPAIVAAVPLPPPPAPPVLAMVPAVAQATRAPTDAPRPAYDPGQQVREAPVVLSADEVVYDRDRETVTAIGNVEIVQNGRVVRADTISFNRASNVVTASGNVSLLEPTGDVIFADYAELTEDLREGAIQNFRALLADWSRLAAVSGRRAGGSLTALRKVVYSPCELCKDDPTRPPIWQLKAARATHDQETNTVAYRDAWLEVGGVPVLYTPYLEHPDGTVRRKSGFLMPAFGSSNVLGQFYAQPYFQTLGQSADVTIEPIFFTKDYPVLAAEYRQRFGAGRMLLNGSATWGNVYDDSNRRTGDGTFRGHIAGTGRFDIDDDWRWGFELARASHDNYLLRYKLFDRFQFIDRNTLTSRPYVEGFRGRSYAAAQAYAFQGLRPRDDPSLAPLVLPLLEYQWLSEPDIRGGYFHFDSYSYAIYRTEGTRAQRTAGIWGYTMPFTASTGEVWSFTSSLQGDLFNVSDAGRQRDRFSPSDEGFRGRIFPQASLTWRYPLVRVDESFRTIVEPIVSVTAAPRVSKQDRLPNEDSRAIDLDNTNLFRRNRFTGHDRVEGGQRISYGLAIDTRRRTGGGRLAAFLGQSYRFQRDGNFPGESGLEDNASNIVGRILFSPHEWLSSQYRFQINKNDFNAARNVASVRIGPEALNLTVGYTYIERSTQPSLVHDLEQVTTRLTARFDENWQLVVRDSRSLS
ncbi:MAG: LPS-assembly protein LptD, partial [Alphaproteobacteria bacterium]|nr:LPS-assembly protein LptD [Alphaproteobacteria bacterium]